MAKRTAAASKKTAATEPWERKRPSAAKKTTLTAASKAKAKKQARQAGRTYPNLVDNMHAAAEQRSASKGTKKKGTKKSPTKKKAR